MNLWSIALLSLASLGLAYAVLAWALLLIDRRKLRASDESSFLPAISVFKPLKGLDESLWCNLETFFRLDYPRYELVFGVNDLDDPAIAVVQSLQRKYPHIPTALVVDTYRHGYNPKVNNLCNMASSARFDYWVISDSNVRVEPNYLRALVAPMHDSEVGLVTSLVRGVGAKRLGARLENLHLNSFIAASTVAVSRLTNIPVTIGKSMLIRRQTLDRLGGFEAYADFLLEDGLLGRHVKGLGHRVEICLQPVDNVNELWSVKNFVSRHFRWALMRRKLNAANYSLEILSSPVVMALAAVAVAPSVETTLAAAAIIMAKTLIDIVTIRLSGGATHPASLLLLPFKDLLIGLVWTVPFFTDKVVWRGNYFRIGEMTRITPIAGTATVRRSRVRQIPDALAWLYRFTKERFALESSEA